MPHRRAAFAFILAALLILSVSGQPAGAGEPEGRDFLLPELLFPERARPGDPVAVWVLSSGPFTEGRLELFDPRGRRKASAAFFQVLLPEAPASGAILQGAVIALPIEAAGEGWSLRVRGGWEGGQFARSLPLPLAGREFIAEDLPLDQRNTALRSAPDPRKDEEARSYRAILDSVDPAAVYLEGGFILPVGEAPRSSTFGDRRRYLYVNGGSELSVHAGIDYAVPEGSPVLAAGRGKVVFAGQRIVTGGTVVLEHLPGVYTVSMHLSSLKVAAGAVVQAGETIGLAGTTGLATGPHLHWELRINGEPADPERWVQSPPLDKARIISRMTALFEGR